MPPKPNVCHLCMVVPFLKGSKTFCIFQNESLGWGRCLGGQRLRGRRRVNCIGRHGGGQWIRCAGETGGALDPQLVLHLLTT